MACRIRHRSDLVIRCLNSRSSSVRSRPGDYEVAAGAGEPGQYDRRRAPTGGPGILRSAHSYILSAGYPYSLPVIGQGLGVPRRDFERDQ